MEAYVSNHEFLAAHRLMNELSDGDVSVQWICHFQGVYGSWAGKVYNPNENLEFPQDNTYFCISLLKPINGKIERKKEYFAALPCIVLDDIGTKALPPDLKPSWIIETSPGNQQWGYLLCKPITNITEADAVIKAIIDAGYCDPGAGGPATRYMRLPCGSNAKIEHSNKNNGHPIPHKTVLWQPDKYFTLEEIGDSLALDLNFENQVSNSKDLAPIPPHSDIPQLIRNILDGTSIHNPAVRLAAHLAGSGYREKQITDLIQGIVLTNSDNSQRWKDRIEDIPRISRDAIKKFQGNVLPSAFSYVDFASLLISRPPPREWIVDQWIPRGVLTSFFSRGGAGKSTLSQQLAICVADQKDFLGLPTTQGTVLGYFCEDESNELLRRGLQIFSHYSCDIQHTAKRLWIDSRVGKANILATYDKNRIISPTQVFENLYNECTSKRPDLVIIDNIAQTYSGGENVRAEVTEFCNLLSKLALDCNCAVLLIGHTAKAMESEYSGSSAWDAAVRSRLHLRRNTDGSLCLEKAKANYSMLDKIEIAYHEGAFIKITDEMPGQTFERARESIKSAIEYYTSKNQNCSQHPNANNYLIRMMIMDNLGDGFNKTVLHRTLEQLIQSKALIPDAELEFRNASGHRKKGLIVSEHIIEIPNLNRSVLQQLS